MAIRDSQTGRLWSARQTDRWARIFETQMAARIKAARAADYRGGGEMDKTKAKTEFNATDHDCPDGHGPMVLYPSAPDDDTDDFYECPACGHRQEVAGQRTATEDSFEEMDLGQLEAVIERALPFLEAAPPPLDSHDED